MPFGELSPNLAKDLVNVRKINKKHLTQIISSIEAQTNNKILRERIHDLGQKIVLWNLKIMHLNIRINNLCVCDVSDPLKDKTVDKLNSLNNMEDITLDTLYRNANYNKNFEKETDKLIERLELFAKTSFNNKGKRLFKILLKKSYNQP